MYNFNFIAIFNFIKVNIINIIFFKEGTRYNSMHVAARYDQPEIVKFIMECVTSSEFIKNVYGTEESYLSRSEIISDLYLNTPDKAANDTPLHIASKFGHVNVVRQLVSYDKCILTSLNKYNETPKDVSVNNLFY